MARKCPYYIYLLLLLAVCCSALLFVGGPGGESGRLFQAAWQVGHILCFALWAFLYVFWRRAGTFVRLLVEALLLTLFCGGATELIQARIGRTGDWADLVADLLGCVMGVLVYCSFWRRASGRRLLPVQLLVLLFLLWSLVPLGKVVADEIVAAHQFPLLSGFETPLESSRWSGSAARFVDHRYAFSGEASLCVQLTTQLYSGLGLRDFVSDWSAYRYLSLQVYNPETEPLQLYLRVHDRLHSESQYAYSDRYNTSFKLHQGWNQLLVPLAKVVVAPRTRQLDLAQIAGMGIFVGQLEHSRQIYLDEVQLLY
jgi:VanZ family protein